MQTIYWSIICLLAVIAHFYLIPWSQARKLSTGGGALAAFWPDVPWLIPLLIALVLWGRAGSPHDLRFTMASLAGLISFLFSCGMYGLWFGAAGWTATMAPNLSLIAHRAMSGGRMLSAVRCFALQGDLLIVLNWLLPQYANSLWYLALIALIIGVTFALFFAQLAVAFRRYGYRSTPFDDFSGTYDFFVSYKSRDANTVRQVVDQLISLGVRVWFAEYQIVLRSRDLFQRAIDYGIQQAKYGLVFTNDHYIQSEYVRIEVDQMLARKQADKFPILEVAIPDEPDFGKYIKSERTSAKLELSRSDPQIADKVCSFMHGAVGKPERVDLPGADLTGATHKIARGIVERLPFSFDVGAWHPVGGWERRPSGVMQASFFPDNPEVPLTFDIQCRRMDEAQFELPRTENDRELYNLLLDIGVTHFAKRGRECLGLHLYFLNGVAHIAFTSWSGICWNRNYWLVLPHPVTNEKFSIVFEFQAHHDFRSFCGLTRHMERIVGSFQWDLSDDATNIRAF